LNGELLLLFHIQEEKKNVMKPTRVSPLYTLTCSHTLFSRHQVFGG
jgi:hypothetical protein